MIVTGQEFGPVYIGETYALNILLDPEEGVFAKNLIKVEYLLLGTSPPKGAIELEEVFVTTLTEAFPFVLLLKPTTILKKVASFRLASKLKGCSP